MRTLFLLPALKFFNPLLTDSTHFRTRHFHKTTRVLSLKMTTESTPSALTHAIALPGQLDQPVTVVAAAGVSESDFRNAIECSLFKQWLKNIQTENGLLSDGTMSLRQVIVQGVDMFGKRVGFLKFKADVIHKQTGNKVPGIVFARGPAVAVLILLDSDGETYAVLTEQVRVPVGKLMLELPAGMLDDDKGDIVGTAVQEETGLHLNMDDLVDLTAFLDPSTGNQVFPSPGGCDEGLGLFLYRGSVDKEIIRQLQGKETGLRDHGELIQVRVVPYKNLWRNTGDAKVLMAISLYEMAKRDGLLPLKD
ncbi:nudix hydrolase-like protein 14 [Perilla frutescens var. hirtella]|uniref:Nudix hydrolase-like protein 14 n=1 Tax=Perilla frutescens var. hirtella TaxID=608512 RepID=A0AAD4INF7_PERFH|nr:nudix hydrolase-like protein 14 [Perilla frutescens var. hirtella]